MPLKPIDKRKPEEKREAVWAAIRELGRFTIRDIEERTLLNISSIRTYVLGLLRAGYLERKEEPVEPGCSRYVYSLVRDCGIEAPRVRKDGTEVTLGHGREQMWRTMRILGEFSALDLAVHASTEKHPVNQRDARDYIYHLHKAGYVVCIRPGKPGFRKGTGSKARYRFIPAMYTGPKAPVIQRVKQVYDPNTGEVVWPRQEKGGGA